MCRIGFHKNQGTCTKTPQTRNKSLWITQMLAPRRVLWVWRREFSHSSLSAVSMTFESFGVLICYKYEGYKYDTEIEQPVYSYTIVR